MKIFLAGDGDKKGNSVWACLIKNRLVSYANVANEKNASWEYSKKIAENKNTNLFLDSGAFSLFTKGKQVDIKEYAKFILRNKKWITHAANLDEIGNDNISARNSVVNYKTLKKLGVDTVPCFHMYEPFEYLEKYIKENEFVALGGMAATVNGKKPSMQQKKNWLDVCFKDYICDNNGKAKVKIHGFGMTSLPLLLRYPWHSVDSTSWLKTGFMGSILIPVINKGQRDYSVRPYKVVVSEKGKSKKEYIKYLSPLIKKATYAYIKEAMIFSKKQGYVFTIEDLLTQYEARTAMTIYYFRQLEKYITKQQCPFDPKLFLDPLF